MSDEHHINNELMKLQRAIAIDDEKNAASIALGLVGIFLNTMNRIAEALERNRG